MLNQVKILDETTANLIAAGEIVETPTSVIKELVENSLDAGSNKIDIIVEQGGRNLIQIRDNGHGMTQKDALLALERHATSKIEHINDLYTLNTLGFRGEALPSIAAVSKMEIVTKIHSQVVGTHIKVDGGKVSEIKDIGAPQGTNIKVRSLFFNTPARLQHQKSEGAELARISDLITRLAFSHPNTAFSLISNTRHVLTTSGDGNLLNAISTIYGVEIAEKMISMKHDRENVSITGYIGKPELVKSSRFFQTIIVNGRYVRSRAITEAMERSYATLLPIKKFPVFVLNLTMPSKEIDANIHPAKIEVRFLQEGMLIKFIENVVRRTLLTSNIIPGTKEQIDKNHYQPQADIKLTHSSNHSFLLANEKDTPIHQMVKETANTNFINTNPALQQETLVSYVKSKGKVNGENLSLHLSSDPQVKIPNLIFSYQIFKTYWLGRDEVGREYWVDQHAAHERVLYEQFINDRSKGEIGIQYLLVPYLLTFTPHESEFVRESIEFFNEFGISVSDLGGNNFSINSVPFFIKELIDEKLMQNVIEKLVAWRKVGSIKELIHPFCTVLSCRSAIKAGTKVNIDEFNHIWQQLRRTENPFTCPHGRPTFIEVDKDYFAKKFKRL